MGPGCGLVETQQRGDNEAITLVSVNTAVEAGFITAGSPLRVELLRDIET